MVADSTPNDNALIDWVANLFIPNAGHVSDEQAAKSAAKAAEAFGYSRGWTREKFETTQPASNAASRTGCLR